MSASSRWINVTYTLGMLLPSGCFLFVVLVTTWSSLLEELLFAARSVLIPLVIAVSLTCCGIGVLNSTSRQESKSLAIAKMVPLWILWQIFLVPVTALICQTLLKKS